MNLLFIFLSVIYCDVVHSNLPPQHLNYTQLNQLEFTGLNDYEAGSFNKERQKRASAILNEAILSSEVTWSLAPLPHDCPYEREVRYTIRKALKIWEDYGNINFYETEHNHAEILFRFVSGAHNLLLGNKSEIEIDPNAVFDGPAGALGHFLPLPEHALYRQREVHINIDKLWEINMKKASIFNTRDMESDDLLFTILHESGHALGMRHGDRPSYSAEPTVMDAGSTASKFTKFDEYLIVQLYQDRHT